ncbi:hypothetical protein Dtox_4064 [Desulfofarcimen acetoxidans DSM 771]|uniref:Uncharacterized protein n=1 Tax=Desulfofarcimen acetoxidans (strain ATCC 49208 / DSM 771 / KCTC 5769 / VKM B-1644 / 5575) TaxID=485916 RepID=C8VYJ4_DESAS|nr:hypothetical protein [Desulfofarcimen acetoxidans]ACV64715.1 hypothetical protein Dtox_4032 [Desulfofarcimen acetoxidans DSM 771]ACV64724.1 hypothetical protein Dtox_4044 [Desulfofarcimen acetoxidans DSM 771]ACV64741.1 hypothetical protein Dtox_4064 [Desulfofarcimen acetoxidans DSM 771]
MFFIGTKVFDGTVVSLDENLRGDRNRKHILMPGSMVNKGQ